MFYTIDRQILLDTLIDPLAKHDRASRGNAGYMKHASEVHQYWHVYQPDHAGYLKNMIFDSAQIGGPIPLVAVVDAPMPQTSEHISLGRRSGVPCVVVRLNRAGLVDDTERLRLVDAKVRELLSHYGYPATEVPIRNGSAIKALESDSSASELESIVWRVAVMGNDCSHPRDIDGPFLMPIEDFFPIKGRATVVTGRVERGTVKVGDRGEIAGINETRRGFALAWRSPESFGMKLGLGGQRRPTAPGHEKR